MGWAIFPLQGKKPFAGTDGFKSASNDDAAVKALFAKRNGCNVGIATGQASGVFVLDVDVKDNAGGVESFKALVEEFGKLPDTVAAKTWSDGFHFYFNLPHDVEIRNKAGFRPGLDIRGDGGYVVAPPSTYKDRPYRWGDGLSPDDVAVADAPEWLLSIITEPTVTPSLSSADDITENRNDTLMRHGTRIRHTIGCDAAQIKMLLMDINAKRCKPPLPESEVTTIANSVAKHGVNEPFVGPLTDVYNAQYFTDRHGDEIRFCDSLGGWHVWDGRRWEKDENYRIMKHAKETAKAMYQQGVASDNKHIIKHAVSMESKGKLEAMISLARSNDIAVKSEVFDQDIWHVNCANGTLDLRTRKFSPPRKEDYCTKATPVNYNPDAKAPRWKQFLDEVFSGDQGLIDFMQRAVGYSLSGSVQEHCFFILWGIGRNGKSTFLKHIQKIMGDYATSTPAGTLMEKYNDAIPNDIARLKGTRFVSTTESGQNRRLAEPVVKALTGDDPITARFLHKEFFTFSATFKIFLATNHKPDITGTDKGIWSRVVLVPFDYVLPPEKQDHHLDEKLEAEHEGIFAWAVEGFRKWQEDGLGTAGRIDEMKEQYQEDSDIIGQFISECCDLGPGQTSVGDMTKAVGEWCKDAGIRTIKRNVLNDYLLSKGITKDRASSGVYRGKAVWYGVQIKSKYETNDNGVPF
jgi:putative DNA primase/helicase